MAWNFFDWLDDLADDIFQGLLKDPAMILARDRAKDYAAAYHLDGDHEAFRSLWLLTIKASLAAKAEHDNALTEVLRSIDNLKLLVDRTPDEPTRFGSPVTLIGDDGLLTAQVANTAGSYVIFSDYHMLPDGVRQNFFKDTAAGAEDGNHGLYLEILSDYYGAKDYCLVENGDVEELLIYEPVLAEIEEIGGWSWEQIFAYRDSKKRLQLGDIARDNRDYYQTLDRHFIAKEKYFRITGNHDRNMREQAFAGLVGSITGVDFPVASDVLLLRGSRDVDYVICHGHQFDTACTPKYAAQMGESFSQASAWAYQGPDRVWRERYDPIGDWLAGNESYRNELVTDLPEDTETWLESAFAHAVPGPLGQIAGSFGQDLIDGLGAMLGTLDTERGWETLYGKNIAWEYFDHAGSPSEAIEKEVAKGKRWFKFRHMNEFRLVDRLEQAFGDRIPTLVLGHSHEPRFRPGYNVPGKPRRQIDFYLNSGAAGRFENLIWGIELIDGEPFLISWHREKRGTGSVPVRTLWDDVYTGSSYVLRPQSSATLDELLSGSTTEEEENPALLIAADHALS